jgi:hypothetical protein
MLRRLALRARVTVDRVGAALIGLLRGLWQWARILERTFIAVFVVAALLFLLFVYANTIPLPSPEATYWLQVLTGNWDSTLRTGVSRFSYWLGVIAAVGLSLGPISLILTWLYKLIRAQRKSDVKIVHAFDMKDATIKDELYAALQKIMSQAEVEKLSPVIEAAFINGSEIWANKHLPDVLGKDVARRFVAMTQRTAVGPDSD